MSPEMWDIIQDVIVLIITVTFPVALGFIVSEARKFSAIAQAWLQNKLGKEDYDLMVQMAHDAVATAEQLGLTEKIGDFGEAKKEFALAKVQSSLTARGIYIDINEIDAAIEAAVNQTFHQ